MTVMIELRPRLETAVFYTYTEYYWPVVTLPVYTRTGTYVATVMFDLQFDDLAAAVATLHLESKDAYRLTDAN